MKILPLNVEERQLTGFTHKVIATYADIPSAASGTKATLKIFPKGSGTVIPAGSVVRTAAWYLKTQFTGGALTVLTASVGDGASDTALIAAASVLSGATPITYKSSTGLPVKTYTATDVINIVFTPTSDAANNATAGELHVFLDIRDLNDLLVTS